MGRPERPLDSSSGPRAQLACKLRELRRAAGLTYRQLGRKTHYNYSTMCLAASGVRVPSWEVTLAFITVCEAAMGQSQDRYMWEALWKAANGQAQR